MTKQSILTGIDPPGAGRIVGHYFHLLTSTSVRPENKTLNKNMLQRYMWPGGSLNLQDLYNHLFHSSIRYGMLQITECLLLRIYRFDHWLSVAEISRRIQEFFLLFHNFVVSVVHDF